MGVACSRGDGGRAPRRDGRPRADGGRHAGGAPRSGARGHRRRHDRRDDARPLHHRVLRPDHGHPAPRAAAEARRAALGHEHAVRRRGEDRGARRPRDRRRVEARAIAHHETAQSDRARPVHAARPAEARRRLPGQGDAARRPRRDRQRRVPGARRGRLRLHPDRRAPERNVRGRGASVQQGREPRRRWREREDRGAHLLGNLYGRPFAAGRRCSPTSSRSSTPSAARSSRPAATSSRSTSPRVACTRARRPSSTRA